MPPKTDWFRIMFTLKVRPFTLDLSLPRPKKLPNRYGRVQGVSLRFVSLFWSRARSSNCYKTLLPGEKFVCSEECRDMECDRQTYQ